MMQRWAKRNPERAAWVVLWAAFAVFVCLAVSVPLSGRWYLLNATRPQNAYLEKIDDGMLTVQERRGQEPIAVNSGRDIKEGFRVTTGPYLRATITFFENSTALLYGNSQVLLERLRRPRFSLSPRPDEVKVALEGGLVRFRVAEGGERARLIQVQTPHAQVRLEAGGSYSVEVTDEHTRIVVRYGRALVLGQKTGVELEQGERVDVGAEGEPGEPMPAAQNLVVNGDFRQPLDIGWKVTPYADLEGVAPGEATIVKQGDRNAVYFVRMGAEEGVHTEISIEQEINRDVRDNLSLVLRLDVRLEYQSLPGAGYRSSEFPVMVELRYRDAYGHDLSWYQGFYYRDPTPNWPMRNGLKIPALIWYPYESVNLIEMLGDFRPVYIHSLRIYASGWNYRSMVSEVGLIAE